jgi:hypothetical protein
MSKLALRKLARQPFGRWETIVATQEQRARFGMTSSRWRAECYRNNRYSVQITDEPTDWGLVVHLWIRRHDGDAARSWADLQRIKDELVGPDRVAIEVFPASSDLVDQANMYHLWVLPEGIELPFGLRR